MVHLAFRLRYQLPYALALAGLCTSLPIGMVNPSTAASVLVAQQSRPPSAFENPAEIPLAEQTLETREQQLGANHPDLVIDLNRLADLYMLADQHSEAEPLYLRALAIREQALGKDNLDVIDSLNRLVELYEATNRFEEADDLRLRAVEIEIHTAEQALMLYEQQLGSNNPDLGNRLDELAAEYQGRHFDVAAEMLYLGALEIREQQLGPDHLEVANSLHKIADFYESLGYFKEAASLYSRALEIREQQLGPDHIEVAKTPCQVS
ncbi:MAG: tetratricopeptide repeat protein [Leptolyngbya sp. SIOISBB]|nr:tetratricopeptide repeat protein [Leptolyngbya sp. SIOISBB]